MVKNKEIKTDSHTKFFSAIGALLIIPLLLVGVYFSTGNSYNYSYKSSAQEAPTVAPQTETVKGVPKYNCQELCDRVFKIPENKVKCINPCNKVGDKVASGMECREACDKSIQNGARKQFCYKFCGEINVGAP